MKCKEFYKTDKNYFQVKEKWGKTQKITRVPLEKNKGVLLENLLDDQMVCFGDGKTYYFLLEKK